MRVVLGCAVQPRDSEGVQPVQGADVERGRRAGARCSGDRGAGSQASSAGGDAYHIGCVRTCGAGLGLDLSREGQQQTDRDGGSYSRTAYQVPPRSNLLSAVSPISLTELRPAALQ